MTDVVTPTEFAALLAGPKKSNKFFARKTSCDGYTFDSQSEANHYLELKSRLQAGDISALIIHPCFELQPAFTDYTGKRQRPIMYTADFSYTENGRYVVVDVKGGTATQTALFAVKAKMLKYHYPHIEFKIVIF